MMLSKAGSYAQAWHNVYTANSCAYEMWLQKQIYNLNKTHAKARLGTMYTQPALVHTTRDYKNEFKI
jgi:NADP-dependent 3-hydroxy acid dehydrogenase YdfG